MNSKLFPIIPFAMIIAKVPSAFIFAKKSGHITILLNSISSQQTNINSNTKCCFAVKVFKFCHHTIICPLILDRYSVH